MLRPVAEARPLRGLPGSAPPRDRRRACVGPPAAHPRWPAAAARALLLALLVGGTVLAAPPGARADDAVADDTTAEGATAGGTKADGATAGDRAADLAEGLRRLEEGRPAEAVAPLERALAAAADEAERGEAAAALGRALVGAGEPYAALQHLETAADRRGRPEDHLALAEALLAVGRENAGSGAARSIEVLPYLEDAIAAAGRAAGEGPVRARRQAVVGEAQALLGRGEAALEAWSGLDRAVLPEAEARRLLDLEARTLYGLGRFLEAVAAWEQAGNARGVAAALSAAREGERAAEAYARLVEEDPQDEALLDEAVRAARYAGAEADLAGALAALRLVGPAAGGVLLARGLLSEAAGALEAAEGLLAQAAEARPEASRTLFELGRVRLRRAAAGDDDGADRAVETLLAALGKPDPDPRAARLLWDLAGQDYALAWKSPRATARTLRVQRALVEADPENPVAWANLGNTLRLAGRGTEALEAYDRALAIDPEDPGALSDRGLVLEALGRPVEALAAFEAAAELDASQDAARQNAARLHWLAGRDEAAERRLAEAEASARAAEGGFLRYRFLLDRVWRARTRPEVR